LGSGSAPHGVIVGPDGAAWVTDGGLNSIVRVDPATMQVKTYPLPTDRNVGLNTAAFDGDGTLWFTGQAGGVYGSLVPATGKATIYDAPRGPGPYGIDATPAGEVWFGSLAGSYLAKIDSATGETAIHAPPTPGAGARRTWSDENGRLYVSEWFVGQLGRYDPSGDEWREWRLPGANPQPYAVYVDELDLVWLTDFGSNSLVRFNPDAGWETFDSFEFPTPGAEVRQLLGRPGEIWGAESGTDKLVVLRWQP
jgi:virginiamycin B lyase